MNFPQLYIAPQKLSKITSSKVIPNNFELEYNNEWTQIIEFNRDGNTTADFNSQTIIIKGKLINELKKSKEELIAKKGKLLTSLKDLR